jgi:uncharacterized membrane protein YvlD (DUF360 family)
VERWRVAGRSALRILAVWAVVTATLAVLAALVPDFRLQSADGDSLTRTGITAAAAAGLFGLLGTLLWPLIVRALLLVPAFVLGMLVFILNGSLLLLALRIGPGDRGTVGHGTAVVIAAALSAASSSANAWLSVHDDEAYRRRLARLAGRRRSTTTCTQTPGTVFIQLDGVGHDVLRTAVETRQMPTVRRWLASGSHRLVPWRTDWSSQTGASQLAILHGSNHDVPAFRWYDKETGRLVVCNRPTNAAELEHRHDGRPGLLAHDGASRGNLFSGGAGQNALVLSVSGRPGRRSRSGYFAYFSDPANATRTVVAFAAEVVRELCQGLRQRLRDERPRVPRGGLYPLIRAFATVVERDVVVAAVMGDVLVGRTAVYADLVAYDEVAHHSGPHSPDAMRVLRRLDRSIGLIAGAARYAPRPYRFVLLSDHGQSHGETFRQKYGLSLEDLVRAGCGLPAGRRGRRRAERGAEARGCRSDLRGVAGSGTSARGVVVGPRRAASTPSSALRPQAPDPAPSPTQIQTTPPWAAARAALRRREGAHAPDADGDPIVLASGNLGLVSFPGVPHRMTYEEIRERHPGLLPALTGHPGIGFVLVRSRERGPLVLGGGGLRVLATGEVEGADPLAPFGGETAARAVLRTDSFPHAADLMVNSRHDPATGEVHAFEEQVGSHGGLGGAQSHPFLLHPVELPLPGGGPVGAETLHRVLRGWLDAAGPAVPPARRGAATGSGEPGREPTPGEPERVS